MKPSQLGSAFLVLLTAACGGDVVLGGQQSNSAGTGGLDSAGQTAGSAAGNDGTVVDTVGSTAGSPGTALDACTETNQQALTILNSHCGKCHAGSPNVPGGAPPVPGAPLTFITDVTRLKTTTSPSLVFLGQPYIIPGDPDHSLIYRRAVIQRDMPPRVLGGPLPPDFLSASEASVIRYWITSCVY